MKKLIIIVLFLAIHPLFQAQESQLSNWKQDGPLTPHFNNQSFRGWVDAICVNAQNPKEMLIATRTSGIFRTENKGENWYCVTDSLTEPIIGCRAMISLPSDPNRVIAITGYDEIDGGVIISDDFGKTWRNLKQNLPTFHWIDFHPSQPNLLFACSKDQLFYSTNKGEKWKTIGTPDHFDAKKYAFFKILVKEKSVSVITKARWKAEALLHEYTFKTKRKGRIRLLGWSGNLANNYRITPDDNIFFMDFSNRAGKVHYFQFESNKGKRTYRTSDGGKTYTLLSIKNFPVGHWWKNELIASPTNPNIVYWGQVGLMQKFNLTTGKSTYFQNDSVQPGHHDDYRSSHILSLDEKDYLALGHDGGVGLVTDLASERPSIVNANGDVSINLIHAFDVHEKTGRIVYAYQDGPMFYRDTDGTFSEQFIWEGSAAMIQKMYPDEIVGENAYTGISDKDETIHPIVDGILGRGGCYLGGYFITYHHFPNRFARGLRKGKIAMNRGVNISEEVKLPNTDSDVGAVAVCARNPNYIYAATQRPDAGNNKLYASTDDGKTWKSRSNSSIKRNGNVIDFNTQLNWTNIKSIAVDPDDGKIVFCGIAGTYQPYDGPKDGIFRVVKSTDGGHSFEDYSKGLPAVPVDELLAVESDNGLLFCATVHGIFYRTRDMKKWVSFSNQLPKVEITGLKYDYCNNVLYASTYGRGLWKTEVGFEIPNTHTDVIMTDETWEENRILCDNVLVKSGVTLRIKSRVEIYRGKEIKVEDGGKLLLEGGSVKEYCE